MLLVLELGLHHVTDGMTLFLPCACMRAWRAQEKVEIVGMHLCWVYCTGNSSCAVWHVLDLDPLEGLGVPLLSGGYKCSVDCFL